jgi:hypothetical protein
MTHRRQLRPCRAHNSRFFSRFCSRLRIKSVKEGGTNKNGEKQRDYIHANTEEEGLPAANCVKGCSFHWILD